MALFRFATDPPARPLIRTQNLIMRAPLAGDYSAWASLRMQSRDFLTPWEPVWSEDDLTRTSFRLRVKRAAREIASDEAYSLFILDSHSETLLGGLTIGLVRRGVAQACTLGYWMGQRHAGKGHMTEAVRGALDFAFSELALHRVEAACLPNNEPSRRLLERVGFTREGEARGYLRINGVWADHLLYGLLSSEPRLTSATGRKL
ncbi:GNAT family protein [Bosea vestrisii]|uniref:GNAT family N-acetyltransferase n=1 Tax=Bosea vestrisii TaxID=151416 RepID=UPI0024DF638A|nr:GNAT family protein [Bosea vestrisii]WID95585.1 GNAT family protein [Bosea vestrisii]